jgi:hypothetical protein
MTGASTGWPSAALASAALIAVQDVAFPAARGAVAGAVAGVVLAAGAETAVCVAGGADVDVATVPPPQAALSAPIAATTPVRAILCRLNLI